MKENNEESEQIMFFLLITLSSHVFFNLISLSYLRLLRTAMFSSAAPDANPVSKTNDKAVLCNSETDLTRVLLFYC